MIEWRGITDRTSWLKWRQDFLTASDVAAAAGVDKYKSRARLYAEKADRAPGAVENGAMRRGRLFEGAALEYLREEKPTWLIERPNVFIADAETRLACTPDALVTDPATAGTINCQIKIISRPTFERWDGVAPIGYVLQVTAENMLVDATAGVLAVLVVSAFDAELKLFDVPRHAAAEKKIMEIAASFWDDISNNRRPAPDFTRDADLISGMFPRHEPGKVLDLSGDNRLADLLPVREKIREHMANDRKQIEAIDAEIKLKLGDAEAAELPGWRLTWKEETRNYKAKEAYATTSRPLHVKQIEAREPSA